ncbi:MULTISPECIES: TonB-dependent siderophore receptor [unclassified Phyllobacterium]|uniref:TonB-dependent siderophore receptor n=1 Tax=unclassified Phyllobacterium TaxID=2638441 RepID=UPI003012A525
MGAFGKHGVASLLGATVLMGCFSATLVFARAQDQAQVQQYHFDIGAKPIRQSLNEIGRTSGLSIVFNETPAASAVGHPVRGVMTSQQAISILLKGTGLSHRFTNASTVTILDPLTTASSDAPKDGEAIVLDTIVIDGNGENALGPVVGYVAKRTATVSKTDASVMETPQAVNIVTADQLQDQNASNLTEALRYTPGVLGGFEGPADTRRDPLTIRGFEPVQYLDGMIATSGAAITAVTKAEPYNLERIEVLKGPASVLYGMNAPGGLVNMVSKRPTEEARGEVVLEGGSFDRLQGQFDVSGPLNADKTLLYRLIGVARDSGTQVDFQPNDHLFIAPSLTWKPDEDTSLTVLGQYSKDNGGVYQSLPVEGTLLHNPNGKIPRHRTGGDKEFDHYDSEYWNIGYSLEHRFNENMTFGQTVRYGEHDNDYAGAYVSGWVDWPNDTRTVNRTAYVYRNQVNSFAVDNRLGYEFDTGPISHSVLVGLDYNRLNASNQNGDMAIDSIDIYDPIYGDIGPVPIAYSFHDKNYQTGLYAQDVIRFDNFTVMAGVRHDWARSKTANPFYSYDVTEEATTFRLGATYRFDNGIAPYVSYSESFALETGLMQGGGTWKPTTGQQYEVGIRYELPDTDAMITLSTFDLRQQNVVSGIPNSPFSVQTGEVQILGVELEAKANINDNWNITASASYLDGKISKDEDPEKVGRVSPNTPKFMSSLWVDYKFSEGDPLGGLTIGGGVRHVGTHYSDQYDEPFRETPAVTLVDAHLKYDFGAIKDEYKGLSLSVNATNIFNKRHYAYIDKFFTTDAPGREINARLAYKW